MVLSPIHQQRPSILADACLSCQSLKLLELRMDSFDSDEEAIIDASLKLYCIVLAKSFETFEALGCVDDDPS